MRDIVTWRLVFSTEDGEDYLDALVVAPITYSFSLLVDRAMDILVQNGTIDDTKNLDVTYAEAFLTSKEGGILVFPVNADSN